MPKRLTFRRGAPDHTATMRLRERTAGSPGDVPWVEGLTRGADGGSRTRDLLVGNQTLYL